MSKKVDASPNDHLNQARRIVFQQLHSLSLAGVEILPRPTGEYQFELTEPAVDELVTKASDTVEPLSVRGQDSTSSRPVRVSEAKPASSFATQASDQSHYSSAPIPLKQRIQQLELVSSVVSSCTKCQDLAACRKNTVFGVGNPQPELCFVGEGPGADEDRVGEPFVGAAGQLLNKIIEACGLSRDEVYILNTVKCRPPGNRNPNEIELEKCWPYAIQQLEILQPSYICCLGSVAARTLLNSTQSIGRMRGQFFGFRGSKVCVTYHPAYLLRNPSAKRQVWDDMKTLMRAMGREI